MAKKYRKNKASKKIATALSIIIAIAMLAFGGYYAYKYKPWQNIVLPNNIEFSANGKELSSGDTIAIADSIEIAISNAKSYTCQLVPGENFGYTIAGKQYAWRGEDMAKVVDIKQSIDKITLSYKKNVQELFASLHEGELTYCDKVDMRNGEYIKLVLSTESSSIVLNVAIDLDTYSIISVDNVTIDKGEIIV